MFDALTIGTATRDVFLRSRLFKTVRDPKHLQKLGFKTGEAECLPLGAKVDVEELIQAVGGGATNAAVTFARYGLKTASVIKIGKDANGRAVLDDLKEEGVNVFPVMHKDAGTAYSAILLSPEGERTILHYRGVADDVKPNEIDFSKLRSRVLYVAPGKLSFAVIAEAIKTVGGKAEVVAMNPSKHYLDMGIKKLTPLFRALNVVQVNREEAAYLTGSKYNDEKRIFKKFDEIVPGIAVMTDGAKGVLVSDGKRIYSAGVFKGKVLDRTGSGDAFGSAFVAALARYKRTDGKWSDAAIREAILAGTANATSVVESIGAQAGILRKSDFASPRFKELKIAVKVI